MGEIRMDIEYEFKAYLREEVKRHKYDLAEAEGALKYWEKHLEKKEAPK
jgi:hypothetical protein